MKLSHCSKGVVTIALSFLTGCETYFRFTTAAVLKQRGVCERGYDIRVYHQSICFLQGWGWRIQSRVVSSVLHFTPPINKICEEQQTRCWKTAMRNSVTSNHEMQLDTYVLWSLYEMILRISCEAFYSKTRFDVLRHWYYIVFLYQSFSVTYAHAEAMKTELARFNIFCFVFVLHSRHK